VLILNGFNVIRCPELFEVIAVPVEHIDDELRGPQLHKYLRHHRWYVIDEWCIVLITFSSYLFQAFEQSRRNDVISFTTDSCSSSCIRSKKA